jgi:hypothetical protein
MVSERIDAVAKRLGDEHARLKTLADDQGGVRVPRYTNPREMTLQLSSPPLAQYVRLILRLDQTLRPAAEVKVRPVQSDSRRPIRFEPMSPQAEMPREAESESANQNRR